MWTAPKSKLSKFSDFVKQTDYLGVTSVSQFDLGVSALASRPVQFLFPVSSFMLRLTTQSLRIPHAGKRSPSASSQREADSGGHGYRVTTSHKPLKLK